MAEWSNALPTGPAFRIAALGGVLSVGMWVGRVNSDRRLLKAFMQEIRDDIRRLEAKFDDRLGRVEQGQARLAGSIEGLRDTLAGRAAG